MFKKTPEEYALAVISRIARSRFIDKYNLRKPLERLIYRSTKRNYQNIQKSSQKKKQQNPEAQASTSPKNSFNLDLSEEQQMLVDMVKSFALEAIRPEASQANEDEHSSEILLNTIADLELLPFVIHENYGGSATEHSCITHYLLIESLAYGDLSIALSSLSSFGFANAFNRFGTEPQKQQWLPQLIDSEQPLKASMAIMEPAVSFNPFELKTIAKKSAQSYKLSGRKTFVANGQNNDVFLVAAKDKIGTGLYIVPKSSQGLSIKTQSAMGLKAANLGELILDKVELPLSHRLGGTDFDTTDYETFINLGRLASCALATGCSQAVLDESISYANQREAFGEPISHRQSIAFMIADMGIELEGMRLMALRATARADHQLAFSKHSYLAKLQCGQKAMQIGTDGVQIFGGHGFTKEYPVERWYRDLRAISMLEASLSL